jgi:hypothetical protein
MNWSTGWEQKLRRNIFVRAAYLERNGSFGFTFRNLLAQPTATRFAVYELQNSRHDRYRGVEFTFSGSLAERAQWMASYVRSSTWSSSVVDYTLENPFFAGQGAGPMDWDTPNRLLASGWMRVRKDWVISSLLECRDGMPFSVVNAKQELVGVPNSQRYPRYFSLNLHVERTFYFGRYRWTFRAGFNNITGHENFAFVDNNTDSPNYLHFGGMERRVFAVRLRYLGR